MLPFLKAYTYSVSVSLYGLKSGKMKVTHIKCGPSALPQQVLIVYLDPSSQFFTL